MPEPASATDFASPSRLRSPVAFFVFNRPDYAARVWETICRARPAILMVVADGPRHDRPDDNERCAAVRRIVTGGIDWPCDRRFLFSDTNLGCRGRIASGLRWVFGQVEESIILEDDCLPDSTFFPFCQELLERYRGDMRVGMISGTNYRHPAANTSPFSYFASRHFSIWGWATWRRAVAGYDESLAAWRTTVRPCDMAPLAPHRATRLLFKTMFDLAREGGADTWDIAWGFHLLTGHAFSLVAARNLVTNIGVEGMRGRPGDPNQLRPAGSMDFPLCHPSALAPDLEYDRLVTKQHRIVRDWLRGLWTLRLKRALGLNN